MGMSQLDKRDLTLWDRKQVGWLSPSSLHVSPAWHRQGSYPLAFLPKHHPGGPACDPISLQALRGRCACLWTCAVGYPCFLFHPLSSSSSRSLAALPPTPSHSLVSGMFSIFLFMAADSFIHSLKTHVILSLGEGAGFLLHQEEGPCLKGQSSKRYHPLVVLSIKALQPRLWAMSGLCFVLLLK